MMNNNSNAKIINVSYDKRVILNTKKYNTMTLQKSQIMMKYYLDNINKIIDNKHIAKEEKIEHIYNLTTLIGCMIRKENIPVDVSKYIKDYYITNIETIFFSIKSPFRFNYKGFYNYNYDNVHNLRNQLFCGFMKHGKMEIYSLPSSI